MARKKKKVGRNQSCPCGSGKKYKRCCLLRHRQSAQLERDVRTLERSRSPAPRSPFTPHVINRLSEKSEQFDRMLREDPERALQFWTTSRVAAMPTEQILWKLRQLGTDVTEASFRARAAEHHSSWALSSSWRETARRRGPLDRHDDDFMGLAACELWRRWLPERPSEEMLDDWMQEAYKQLAAEQEVAACEQWCRVWAVIRERLRPEMTTCEAARDAFDGSQSLHNWLQDFAMSLRNAALEEPRFAAEGVGLCRDVVAQFPDEYPLFRFNFRGRLGEFLALAGKPEEGVRELELLLAEDPDDPAAYARLSDLLGFGLRGPEDAPIDRPRAIALLEEALARPVRDPESWGLAHRLEQLRSAEAG